MALLAILHEILIRTAHDIDIIRLRDVKECERVKHALICVLYADLVLLRLCGRKNLSPILIGTADSSANVKILRMAAVDGNVLRRVIGQCKRRRCRRGIDAARHAPRVQIVRLYIRRMMVHAEQDIPFLDTDFIDKRDALDRGLVVHRLLVCCRRRSRLVHDARIDISCPEAIYGATILCCLTCTPRTIDRKGQIVFCCTGTQLPVYPHLDIARTLRGRRRLLVEVKIARIIFDDECAITIHDILVQLVLEIPGVDEPLPVL